MQHIWFQGVARHEKRISAHLATVCSHQQHNRPHDVTGSCLIGLQLAVGSRKLICGSNKSCPRISSRLAFAHVFSKPRSLFWLHNSITALQMPLCACIGANKNIVGFYKPITQVSYVIKHSAGSYCLCGRLVFYVNISAVCLRLRI